MNKSKVIHPAYPSISAVFLFVFTLSFSANQAHAVPAAPIVTTVEVDSKLITVRKKGDEWTNWLETESGYAIAPNASGEYFYVERFDLNNPVLSSIPVTSMAAPEGLTKGLSPSLLRPSRTAAVGYIAPERSPTGDFNGSLLFLLVQYEDEPASTSVASWANFVKNNVRHYFTEASHGKVNFLPAIETSATPNDGVIGWLTLGKFHPHTGEDLDARNQQISRDAILAADPYIDYSSFDQNNDGFIDSDELSVVVIVAGPEAAYGGLNAGVWGHAWAIWEVTTPLVDGVRVGAYHRGQLGYAQFGEMQGSHQATMGVMVHEIGHLTFGLPDLYDYDGSSSGIGPFGLMAGGSWGEASTDVYAGETPVMPSAWTKTVMGWSSATEGSGTESLTASGAASADSNNTVRRASTGASSEYFLVENRQPVGYDRGLERYLGTGFGGLAIWHIDDTQTDNDNDTRRWVDLEQADKTEAFAATSLWRQGNMTTFNSLSSPGSNNYAGQSTGVDINTISASSTVMTAHFGSGGGELGPAPEITSPVPGSALSGKSETFVWDPDGISPIRWRLRIGTTGAGSYDLFSKWASLDSTSLTVNGLPTDGGALYVRLSYKDGSGWHDVDYTYTAADDSTGEGGSGTPVITSPAPGSILTGSSETFVWDPDGVSPIRWRLRIGTTGAGSDDLLSKRASPDSTSITVNGLPTNGGTLYIRLSYKDGNGWHDMDYTYTAADTSGGGDSSGSPQITSPEPGSTFAGSSETFVWDADGMTPMRWKLRVGTTGVGSQDLYSRWFSPDKSSATVSDLPTDGGTLYVRLSYKDSSGWHDVDYTYIASSP